VGQYALIRARERAAGGEDVTLVGLSSTRASVEDEALGQGRLRIVRVRRPLYDRRASGGAAWTLRTSA
jgi:hypothetical protein